MDVRSVGSEQRGEALVEDLVIDPGGGDPPIEAFLAGPATPAPRDTGAGVLFAHWFDPEAPDGDRTQFLEEAVGLARDGVTSVLPQGRFPWSVAPSGAAADTAAIETEVRRLRTCLDVLAGRPTVDPARLAVVGHDFGGMAAVVAAGEGPRLRGLVVVAATPRWGDWFLPFWPIPDDRIDYLRALRPLDPVERIGQVRADRVLLQVARADFYIAPMSGLELRRAGPEGTRLESYESDHAMREPAIRDDRRRFLEAVLGLAPTAS